MSKIKMSNKEIARHIGEMCFDSNNTKERQAVQLFFEKTCLPTYEKSYTGELMAKYILYFMKNGKMFQPTPSKTTI